jgi:hypothetical protein
VSGLDTVAKETEEKKMSNFAEGREQRVLLAVEAAYGTQVKAVGTGGLRVLSFQPGIPNRERRYREDKRLTRSAQAGHFGRHSAEWTLKKYLMTSGALGTAPDDGELLKALLGKETVTGSVSVAYEPDSTVDLQSLDLYGIQGHFMEGVIGAAVNQAVIAWGGGEEITIEYSGPAKKGFFAGTSVANGAGSAVTALIVDEPYRFTVGGLVQIDTDDNSGAGYQITAIDYATATLTIGTAATWSDDDPVTPFLPVPTTAGDPIMGTLASMTIDTVALAITTGQITVNNQLALVNDEAGTDSASGIVTPKDRLITFDLTAYLKKAYMDYVGKALQGVDGDFVILLGDTSTEQVQIDMDVADYEVNAVEIPDSGEVMLKLTGRAVQNSAGDDEFDMTFK